MPFFDLIPDPLTLSPAHLPKSFFHCSFCPVGSATFATSSAFFDALARDHHVFAAACELPHISQLFLQLLLSLIQLPLALILSMHLHLSFIKPAFFTSFLELHRRCPSFFLEPLDPFTRLPQSSVSLAQWALCAQTVSLHSPDEHESEQLRPAFVETACLYLPCNTDGMFV